MAEYRQRYPSTWVYRSLSTILLHTSSLSLSAASEKAINVLNPRAEKWALRILGCKKFMTGIGPTMVSSFVGSAATLSAFSPLASLYSREADLPLFSPTLSFVSLPSILLLLILPPFPSPSRPPPATVELALHFMGANGGG
jgi:hypothetical protein